MSDDGMRQYRQVYAPGHLLPFDKESERALLEERLGESVSDDQLSSYIDAYFTAYRAAIEEFFPQIASVLGLYARFPFHTTIIRFGPNGIVVMHKASSEAKIEVRRFEDFEPPFPSPNIFDIAERLTPDICWFDFAPRSINAEGAKQRAIRDVLAGVMGVFWHSIPDAQVFEQICIQLLEAEADIYELSRSNDATDVGDAEATVVLPEPCGFNRVEKWAFQFRHYPEARVSAAHLIDVEKQAARM